MNPWIVPLIVVVAGALGGACKAAVSGTGDIELPSDTEKNGVRIWRPGWLANPLVGAVSALFSWALYGQASGRPIFDPGTDALTYANVGAAILVGLAGSGWLSAEVDKVIFKKTAVVTAQKETNATLAATISAARPDQALRAALAAN